MGKSFGYNRNEAAENYRSATELLHLLIGTASRGGNLLLDIGPTADGRIPDIMQQRLLDMGEWLKINGDAIYGTTRWAKAPKMDDVKFTQKDGTVYAICLKWPGDGLAIDNVLNAKTVKATMLGVDKALDARIDNGKVLVAPPVLNIDQMPCRHAYVFKLDLVQ
jgi:alpha-L-fucosidase